MKILGNGSEAADKGNRMLGIIRKGIENKLQFAVVHSHLMLFKKNGKKWEKARVIQSRERTPCEEQLKCKTFQCWRQLRGGM